MFTVIVVAVVVVVAAAALVPEWLSRPPRPLPMEQRAGGAKRLCAVLANIDPEDPGDEVMEFADYGKDHAANAWFAAGRARHHYYRDERGRPAAGFALLNARMRPGDRQNFEQWKVGNDADRNTDDYDYDGGHLVGSQFGGCGHEYNLVPQVAQLNRGPWVFMENLVAAASRRMRRTDREAVGYYVRLRYEYEAETHHRVPSHFGMMVAVMHRPAPPPLVALRAWWRKEKAPRGPWRITRSVFVELPNRPYVWWKPFPHWWARWRMLRFMGRLTADTALQARGRAARGRRTAAAKG